MFSPMKMFSPGKRSRRKIAPSPAPPSEQEEGKENVTATTPPKTKKAADRRVSSSASFKPAGGRELFPPAPTADHDGVVDRPVVSPTARTGSATAATGPESSASSMRRADSRKVTSPFSRSSAVRLAPDERAGSERASGATGEAVTFSSPAGSGSAAAGPEPSSAPSPKSAEHLERRATHLRTTRRISGDEPRSPEATRRVGSERASRARVEHLARVAAGTGGGDGGDEGETRESRLVSHAALLWERWEAAEANARVLAEELRVEKTINAEYAEALRAAEAKTRELERAAIARAGADAARLDTSARDEAVRQMLSELLRPKLKDPASIGEADAEAAPGAERQGDTDGRGAHLLATAGVDPQAIALAAEARDVRREAEHIGRIGRLEVELAAARDREALLRTGLERAKAAVEDNAARRDKCKQLRVEVATLRSRDAESRRAAAAAEERASARESECAQLRVKLLQREEQVRHAAELWRGLKSRLWVAGKMEAAIGPGDPSVRRDAGGYHSLDASSGKIRAPHWLLTTVLKPSSATPGRDGGGHGRMWHPPGASAYTGDVSTTSTRDFLDSSLNDTSGMMGKDPGFMTSINTSFDVTVSRTDASSWEQSVVN